MPSLAQIVRVAVIAVGAAVALGGLAGCEENSRERDTQKLPWTKPAAWEGQAPGMGGQAPRY